MWAADNGGLAMTKTLVDAGTKTNIKTSVGETALSLAEAGTKKGYVFGADFNKIIALLQPEEELPGLDELAN